MNIQVRVVAARYENGFSDQEEKRNSGKNKQGISLVME